MEKTRKRNQAKIFPKSRSRRLVEMAVEGNHSTQPTSYKQHEAPCNNGNDNIDDVPIVTEKTPIMFDDDDNIHSFKTTTETPQDNTADASHLNDDHLTQPTSYKQHDAPCNNGNNNFDDVFIVTEKTPVMFDDNNIHSFEITTETPQDNTTDASHLNDTHLTQPTSYKQHDAPCNNGNDNFDDVPIVTEKTPVMLDDDNIHSFETTTETPQDNTTDASHLNDTHLTQPTSYKQHDAPCNNGNDNFDDVPIVTEKTPVMLDDDNIHSFETTTETPQDNTTDASHLNDTHLTQPTSYKQHEAPCNNLYGIDYIDDVPIQTEETFVMFDDTIHCFETTIIETPQDKSTDASNLNDTHLTLPSLDNNSMDIELRLFDNTALNDLDSESLTLLKENVNVTNLEDSATSDEDFNPLENSEPKMNKRKKRHQVNSSTWKINKWKENRKLGKEYVGRAIDQVNAKSKFIKKRCARVIKQRCKCNRKDKSLLQCSTLTEEERKKNFDEFWNLDAWSAKKVFVQLLTRKSNTARPRDRKEETKSRRKNSCQYYLKKGTNIVRVCKTMFLNTLNIGEWTAINWQKKTNRTEDNSSHSDNSDHENEIVPTKKLRKPKEMEALEEFFTSLPKVESHYCRGRSAKLYCEPLWHSKQGLFQFYKTDWCIKKNINSVSLCTFLNCFEDKNLSIFQPKKDACDYCESYKTGNISQEEYEAHILRKDEARVEKYRDKEDVKSMTFTMDLQSLLLSPRSNASALYYKMKLSVHNFTVFNLGTKEGFCYLWNETEGGLSSNEFSTLISRFVLSQLPLPADKEKIVLYSDGCSYQNRCCNLSNALLHVASTKNVIIEQEFLEVGHTQMEADAMHSLIERRLKYKKINVPADYINVCREARKSPMPYNVHYLNHQFFKKFDNHLFCNSIRPGRGIGQSRVNEIRALRYLPNLKFQYKLSFSDEWQDIPQRLNKAVKPTNIECLPGLYEERIKVKQRKFEDLQHLKSILEFDYHSFYDELPH